MSTNILKKFNFEDKNTDFPFYTGETKFKPTDIVLLVLGLIVNLLFLFIINIPFSLEIGYLIYCLIILYVTRGKLGLLFKKLSLKDLGLIFLVIIAHLILVVFLVYLFEILEIVTSSNPASSMTLNLLFWITFIFDMLGEEFFKVIVFLLSLYFVFNISNKRKVAVVIAAFITLFCFGLIHYGTYSSILQAIFIIGFASIFEMLLYIKTHNILTTYLAHLLFDVVTFLPSLFGLS